MPFNKPLLLFVRYQSCLCRKYIAVVYSIKINRVLLDVRTNEIEVLNVSQYYNNIKLAGGVKSNTTAFAELSYVDIYLMIFAQNPIFEVSC